MDTSSWAVGTLLYAQSDGSVTSAANESSIGQVLKQDASVGVIYINVFVSATGGGGGGILTYTSVANAEAASGAENDLIYCVETETLYSYKSSVGSWIVDGKFILSTSSVDILLAMLVLLTFQQD